MMLRRTIANRETTCPWIARCSPGSVGHVSILVNMRSRGSGPVRGGNRTDNGFDVQAWVDAIGRADLGALRAAATDDMVVETVGTSTLLAGQRTFDEFSESVAVLADLTKNGLECEITELIADGDRIAVEFIGRAELADGTTFDETHFVVLYLRDGRVCRVKKYAESELIEAVFGPLVRRRW